MSGTAATAADARDGPAVDGDADAVALGDLPGGALVVDARRRVVAANPTAARLTGWPTDRLVGASLDDLLVDDGTGPGWHRSAKLRSVRGVPEQTVALHRPDGSIDHAVLAATYQRDERGRLQGAVVLLRPVRGRGHQPPSGIEVVSTVSHELRSPLTSVKGYTSLLLNRWDRLRDEQKRMMLEQVHHDADRVTRLVTELLDISRLETGRLVLRRQLVDLRALAASVAEKVRLEYPDLTPTLWFPDDFPRVLADPDKVEQVLTNLLENAAKYASPTDVHVEGTVGDAEITVAVRDRGEGIPAADLPRVFTKFFRREVGRPTGSGLGLWISRGLVEAHGGRLTAESKEGQGSTFAFTLPLTTLDEILGEDPHE